MFDFEGLDKSMDKMSEDNYRNKEHLQEIATLCYMNASKDLPDGMKLEIITDEYENKKGPYLCLFSADHKDGDCKNNNCDLITRVKLTETPPLSADEVIAIADNPPLTENYKKAIYDWSRDNNKRGINNWIAAQIVWDALNNQV